MDRLLIFNLSTNCNRMECMTAKRAANVVIHFSYSEKEEVYTALAIYLASFSFYNSISYRNFMIVFNSIELMNDMNRNCGEVILLLDCYHSWSKY